MIIKTLILLIITNSYDIKDILCKEIFMKTNSTLCNSTD